MAAWESFNKAKAASYTEAVIVVDAVRIGLAGPRRPVMQADLVGYPQTVTDVG